LAGNYETLKAGLGETITRNSVFVEGINKVSAVVKALGVDVDGNRQKWIEWSKQGALAALDFSVAGIKAASTLYSAFAGISGGVKETLAYYYQLKASFLDGAASGAKWKDALGLTTGEAQRLSTEAAAAAAKSDELSASAAKSFAEMDAGAPKILKAAESLQKFRDEMAQVEAKQINIEALGEPAQKMQEEIVKVGEKWVGVTKEISDSNQGAGKDVAQTWEGVWQKFENDGITSVEEMEKALQALTKDRTFKVRVQEVSGKQNGGLVGAYKLGGLIQALANGGAVRNILSGGFLPGFGGGDTVPLYGERGEVMLNKYAVRAAGLKAALAFNSGKWSVVIAELMKLTGSARGYHLGGMVGNMPALPVQGLAAGGAVAGMGSGYNATFAFTDHSGQSGTVHGSEIDIRRLEAAVNKHNRFRSSNR
jgi:CRISPR/Cas system CMR-associated protein Cmr5 small subunit